MQIIVLGMHRSGTSAVAGLLANMGAYFGAPDSVLPPDEVNEPGYWERRDVVAANDRLLAATGAAWDLPLRFAENRISSASRDVLAPEIRRIANELSARSVSIIKDPRLCLTLESWLPFFSKPVCVLVSRNPLEIGRSLLKRRDCSVQTGIAIWEAYARSSLRIARGLPIVHVSFDALLNDPQKVIAKLFSDLRAMGAPDALKEPDREMIGKMIRPKLRHHAVTGEDFSLYASAAQSDLFRRLSGGECFSVPDEPVSQPSREALDYFEIHEMGMRNKIIEYSSTIHRMVAHRAALIAALQTMMGKAELVRTVVLPDSGKIAKADGEFIGRVMEVAWIEGQLAISNANESLPT